MKQENEELKERIRYGAMEYTKMFEKCRLLKNQKFNSEINVYQDMKAQENNLIKKSNHRQTPSHSEDKESDSLSQDKTLSQSARASAADSENTLFDAILGSSFYNGTWSTNSQREQSNQQMASNLTTAATITQPKPSQNHSSDISDDGLVHTKATKFTKQQNLSEQLSQCKLNSNQKSLIVDPKNHTCEICDYIFPTGVNKEELEQHYASHEGLTCPVCFLQFRKDYSQVDFESHVNSHFSN